MSPTLPLNSTLAPTLSSEEIAPRIQELLKTNGDCALPCWWGITPGQSTWAETRQILLQLGTRTNDIPLTDGVTGHGTGGLDLTEPLITIRLYLVEQSEVIDTISLQAEADFGNRVEFQKIFERYFLKSILLIHGPPSRVWVDLLGGIPEPPSTRVPLELTVFYDSQGIMIAYTGSIEYHSNTYQVCPLAGNIAGVSIFLQSPDNPRPLNQAHTTHVHTLEEASGLSVVDFQTVFVQGDDQTCFETPQNIWP